MTRRKHPKVVDADVLGILDGLEADQVGHPSAKIDSDRQNSASIRIRIIDPDFRKTSRDDRHGEIWGCLDLLPEEIQSQITVVLTLTPDETETSIANIDLENPIPSRL